MSWRSGKDVLDRLAALGSHFGRRRQVIERVQEYRRAGHSLRSIVLKLDVEDGVVGRTGKREPFSLQEDDALAFAQAAAADPGHDGAGAARDGRRRR